MLEHNLKLSEKERFDCVNCNFPTRHFRTGKEWVGGVDGKDHIILTMECRFCENCIQIPAERFGTGNLSRLIVRR